VLYEAAVSMSSRDPSPEVLYIKLGEKRGYRDLRQILTAQFRYEKMRAVRRFLLGLLVLLGAGLWLSARRSEGLSSAGRRVGLQLWGLCLIATVISRALERKWHRRRVRLMRETESGPDGRPSSG